LLEDTSMTSDRYLRAVLTVIALELFWIGIKDGAPAVNAQPVPTPTPVIIRGVQIDMENRGTLPISAARPLRVESDRPLRIESLRPMKIEADRPIMIETDPTRPLSVESVPYTPAKRPG
jgi:hypothetical protein